MAHMNPAAQIRNSGSNADTPLVRFRDRKLVKKALSESALLPQSFEIQLADKKADRPIMVTHPRTAGPHDFRPSLGGGPTNPLALPALRLAKREMMLAITTIQLAHERTANQKRAPFKRPSDIQNPTFR